MRFNLSVRYFLKPQITIIPLNDFYRGRTNYRLCLGSLKWLTCCLYSNATLELLKITKNPEESKIEARWRIKGIPRGFFFWEDSKYYTETLHSCLIVIANNIKPGFHKALQHCCNNRGDRDQIYLYDSCMLTAESIQQPQLYGNQALSMLLHNRSCLDAHNFK